MNTPATPETFKNPCNAAIPNWTFGHNRAVKNAAGIMIKNPTKITNVDPWKIPNNSGSFLSKYLLWIHTEIDAITIDPMIEGLGGKDNIVDVTNCVTRLRVNVKDESLVKDDAFLKRSGALGVSRNGKAIQVIIGFSVGQVREAFEKELHK